MTRASGPDQHFVYATFGATDRARTVIVLREGAVGVSDPDGRVTATRAVRVVAVRVHPDEVDDPGAYGSETPASATVGALADLVDDELRDGAGDGDSARIGLVGVGGAGAEAIMLACRLGDRADRLALVAVPKPEMPLDRHMGERVMADVEAKTLILNGTADSDAAADAAAWHRAHISHSRVEMVPAVPGALDGRLSLSAVWDRVLAHTAPGTRRGQ